MSMGEDEVLKKAKHRIKRFIKTGKKQARVRKEKHKGKVIYIYEAIHHVKEFIFRTDKLNRIYFMKTEILTNV